MTASAGRASLVADGTWNSATHGGQIYRRSDDGSWTSRVRTGDFMHFTESFHKVPPADLDWFRIPFLVAGAAVIGLHLLAFSRNVGPDNEVIAARTRGGRQRR